ncbi:MAG: Kelch repeat-containing protein [Leptolyngbyaceae cyanobacterium]
MTKPLASLFAGSVALFAITAASACSPQGNGGAEPILSASSTAWVVVGQLPLPLESHQTVVLNDFLYILGGWNDAHGPYAEVFFTPMTPDGLENWQEASAALPSRLQHHAAIAYGEALYVLGGDNGFWDGSTVSDRIYRATPTAEGDITAWMEVGQLPIPLTVHAVTLVDNRLYVIGGSQTFRPGLTFEATVLTATIADNGEVGAFQTLTPFPTPIGWLTAVAIDQQIFALSGLTQFRPNQLAAGVWVATTEEGPLSPFVAVNTVIPRQRHTTVLSDRTLVVVAGGGDQQVMTSVQAADIDKQGNLTAWRDLAPLPGPRYAHAAFTYEGDVYVSGGFISYGSNETSRDIFRLSAMDVANPD